MLTKLRYSLATNCVYETNSPLLIGVSGGPDSIALLHGLHQLGIPLIAAHLDHGLRNESDNEAAYVAEFSHKLGVDVVLERVDTNAFAQKNKLSTEEAGRELRYSYLFEQADKYGAGGVVVGHHADDQVETVLMHLLRGAGLDGLSGMGYTQHTQWHGRIPLLRPLLNVWRKEIEQYCEHNGLTPLIDRSNIDTRFYRNRIRLELIPTLESYNPNIKSALWKTANTMYEDKAVLSEYIEELYRECANLSGDNSEVSFNREEFNKRSLGIRRRLVRLGLHHIRPDIRDIGYREVEKVLDYVKYPPQSGSAELFQGLAIHFQESQFILHEQGKLRIPSGVPQLDKMEVLSLPVPGEVTSVGGWAIMSELKLSSPSMVELAETNQDPMIAYLDAAAIGTLLTIAPRRVGGRFAPLGMNGKQVKVSEFMINEKIPKSQRMWWPLVYSREDILWIPGYRISHNAHVTGQTKEVVVLKMLIPEPLDQSSMLG